MSDKGETSQIVAAILGGLAAVMLLMAAVFGAVGWSFASKAEARKAWPTTEGVVVKHEVTEYDAYDSRARTTYKRREIDFQYSYEVAGRSYTGKNFNASGAGRPIEQYEPVGAQVVVHYDPNNPSEAGLTVDQTKEDVGFWIAATGLGLLGLMLAGFAVRSFVRTRAAAQAPG